MQGSKGDHVVVSTSKTGMKIMAKKQDEDQNALVFHHNSDGLIKKKDFEKVALVANALVLQHPHFPACKMGIYLPLGLLNKSCSLGL